MKLALLVRWLYPPATGYIPFWLERKTYSPTVLLLLSGISRLLAQPNLPVYEVKIDSVQRVIRPFFKSTTNSLSV